MELLGALVAILFLVGIFFTGYIVGRGDRNDSRRLRF